MSETAKPKEEQAQQQLAVLIDNAEALVAAGVGLLSERQKLRAVRQRKVADRLKTVLKEDDPRLRTAETLAERADAQATTTTRWVKRSAKAPKVAPDDWAIFGNVRLADGEPATGYTVRVCYRNNEEKVEVASAQTNEYGDFFIVIDSCRLREKLSTNQLPRVYLCVQGDEGTLDVQPDGGMEIKDGQIVTVPVRFKKLDQ